MSFCSIISATGLADAPEWQIDLRIGTIDEFRRRTRLRVRVVEKDGEVVGHGILYEIDPGNQDAALDGSAGDETAPSVQVDEAKAQFLSMMSHEIRTPLNSVIGMTGMLRETELTPEQQDYADMVLDSAKSLVALIIDILDFSKLDSDKLELEAIEFDIVHLATNVFHAFELTADSSGIDFMLDIAPGMATRLKGDPGRLRQILVNLVSNAVKFTAEGSISLSLLDVTRLGKPMIRFEVIDTGICVPEAAKARMFTEFSQADSSISRRFGGTGLGLAISEKLVRLMGGEIGFNSTEGVGSRFWFDVPVVEPDTSEPVGAENRSIKGVRVLLVGLSPADCDTVREGLEAGGALIDIRKTGSAALTAFDEAASGGAGTAYGFVVISKDTAEPSAEILAQRPKDETRGSGLVLVTSMGVRGDAARASASGFDTYLTKPLSGRLVCVCLAELARRPDDGAAAPLVTAHSLREKDAVGLHILFADDNDLQCVLAQRLLAARGHRVTTIGDGRAALDAMTKGGFDLVLLDGRMTLLDGLDALRKIRALPEGLGTLPVYIVTGIVEPEKRSAFLEAGVNGVLSKPFETQQLVALVEKVRNARALREPIEAGENDFDADMLVELEHLVGRDELMQIVIAFAAETDASMAALRGHVEEGAIEKLATIAHDLKN